MSNKRAGSINETPSESPGISVDRYHIIGDVRFEGLIQKQSQHPKLIDHLVGLKFLKKKPLSIMLFKSPEHQFIIPPVMVSLDQYLLFKKKLQAGLFQQLVNLLTSTNVGVNNIADSSYRKLNLTILRTYLLY